MNGTVTLSLFWFSCYSALPEACVADAVRHSHQGSCGIIAVYPYQFFAQRGFARGVGRMTFLRSRGPNEFVYQDLQREVRRASSSKGFRSTIGHETVADLVFVVVGYFAILRQNEICAHQKLDEIFLPWFCAMYWIRLVYSLRGELWLGPHLLPILCAVPDTGPFFFVPSLCVAASAHAYIILNPRGEDDFPLYSAFTHTIRLAMFGDFDMFEYQGQDPTYALNADGEWGPKDPSPKDLEPMTYVYLQLLFFSTGVGVTLLLMNLLIGIVGSNYDLRKEHAEVLFRQARARMLLEQERRPWAGGVAPGCAAQSLLVRG